MKHFFILLLVTAFSTFSAICAENNVNERIEMTHRVLTGVGVDYKRLVAIAIDKKHELNGIAIRALVSFLLIFDAEMAESHADVLFDDVMPKCGRDHIMKALKGFDDLRSAFLEMEKHRNDG